MICKGDKYMYKVTLACGKNYDGINIEQQIEFKFNDFEECNIFIEKTLKFSKSKNIKVIIEKEIEHGNN